MHMHVLSWVYTLQAWSSLTKIHTEQTGTTALTWAIPQRDLTISKYEVQFRCGTTSWSSKYTLLRSPPPTFTILNAGTACTLRESSVWQLELESGVMSRQWSLLIVSIYLLLYSACALVYSPHPSKSLCLYLSTYSCLLYMIYICCSYITPVHSPQWYKHTTWLCIAMRCACALTLWDWRNVELIK